MTRQPLPPQQAPLGDTPTLPEPGRELPHSARTLLDKLLEAPAPEPDPLPPSMSASQAHVAASIARKQHKRQRRRAGERDYSIALAMVAQEPAESPLPEPIKEPSASECLSVPATPAFVRAGLPTEPARVQSGQTPALSTRGLAGALVGHDPEGGAVFELMFAEELYAAVRCTVRLHQGQLAATFHISDPDVRRRFTGRLDELRALLERRGFSVAAVSIVDDT